VKQGTGRVTKAALKAFRVDRRVFRAGDPIATAGEFSGKHPEKGKKAEEILAARKPDGKPDRTGCVMVFEDESCARKHWVKMIGGKLYEVEILRADIQHRADMRLVDAIGEALSDDAKARELADRYWAGDMTDNPIVEVLLPRATARRLISGDEKERRAEFKRIYMGGTAVARPLDEEWDEFTTFGKGQSKAGE
jgi:hypothetical protein